MVFPLLGIGISLLLFFIGFYGATIGIAVFVSLGLLMLIFSSVYIITLINKAFYSAFDELQLLSIDLNKNVLLIKNLEIQIGLMAQWIELRIKGISFNHDSKSQSTNSSHLINTSQEDSTQLQTQTDPQVGSNQIQHIIKNMKTGSRFRDIVVDLISDFEKLNRDKQKQLQTRKNLDSSMQNQVDQLQTYELQENQIEFKTKSNANDKTIEPLKFSQMVLEQGNVNDV